MSHAKEMMVKDWGHSPAEMEVEVLVVMNADLGRQIERLALRFISIKGLSEEFVEALKEVEQEMAAETSTPYP